MSEEVRWKFHLRKDLFHSRFVSKNKRMCVENRGQQFFGICILLMAQKEFLYAR